MANKKVRPFGAPGYTPFNNDILDYIMPQLSANGWKVLCIAVRNTWGWKDDESPTGRKEWDRISYSQFRKGTGIVSDATIKRALDENIKKGFLLRRQTGPQDYSYHLNTSLEIVVDIKTSTEIVEDASKTSTKPEEVTSTQIVEDAPETSTETVDTKERSRSKERSKENKNSSESSTDRFALPIQTETLEEQEKEEQIITGPPAQTETAEQRRQRLQEKFGDGPLVGMALAAARGASDESSWTTTVAAGGLDPFTDGPLTAWCDLVGRNRERLQPERAASCARQLRRIAEQQGANAEQLTWALRQWKRAIIAHAFREKGKPVLIPGNQEWQKPTWRSLWVHKDDPDRNMGQELAALLEHGMDHGLADLDLTKDPTVAAVPERRDEPPERMEV